MFYDLRIVGVSCIYHCYFNMHGFLSYVRYRDFTGIPRDTKKGDVILLTVPNTARLFALEVIVRGFIVILLVRSKRQWMHYNRSFVKHRHYTFVCRHNAYVNHNRLSIFTILRLRWVLPMIMIGG